MRSKFKNASEAFDYFYIKIKDKGVEFDNTKALFNVGFYMARPLENKIKSGFRKWSQEYADAEWQWYEEGHPNIYSLEEIYGKIPSIWHKMADAKGYVNSNYGYQWKRNNQLDYVVNLLKEKPDTRRAAISIYDAKEHEQNYDIDTPCTYAVQFTIVDNKLNMSAYMRSNDLWFGFCNDQYQFSMLQNKVAEMLSIDIGWYYHHAHNLHLYNDKV